MKCILLITLILATTTTSWGATSKELLNLRQKKEVLHVIDSICGDTWCEGDYNFRFNDFSCDKITHKCLLDFQFIKTEDNQGRTYSSDQNCSFENVQNFRQIMDGRGSLSDEFYDSLTNCIHEKEDQIQF